MGRRREELREREAARLILFLLFFSSFLSSSLFPPIATPERPIHYKKKSHAATKEEIPECVKNNHRFFSFFCHPELEFVFISLSFFPASSSKLAAQARRP